MPQPFETDNNQQQQENDDAFQPKPLRSNNMRRGRNGTKEEKNNNNNDNQQQEHHPSKQQQQMEYNNYNTTNRPFLAQSWPAALKDMVHSKSTLKILLNDCSVAATARAQLSVGDYSHGTTFWVKALENSAKMTTLEKLAFRIFHSHYNNLMLSRKHHNDDDDEQQSDDSKKEDDRVLDIDLSNSGAEWWTLYMDAEDGGVGWHWDKDYHAELEHQTNLHPWLGTVTYFSESGAPTLIIPKRTAHSTVSSDDYDGPHDYEDNNYDGRSSSSSALQPFYVSRVVPGKHLAFDGRLLHAAPTELYDRLLEECVAATTTNNTKRGPRPKRATLLVNLWFNHQPHDAISLDPALRSRLSSNLKVSSTIDLLSSKHVPSTPCSITVVPQQRNTKQPLQANNNKKKKNQKPQQSQDDSSKTSVETITSTVERFQWEVNSEYSLTAHLPVQTLANHFSQHDMFQVEWQKGTARPFIEKTVS